MNCLIRTSSLFFSCAVALLTTLPFTAPVEAEEFLVCRGENSGKSAESKSLQRRAVRSTVKRILHTLAGDDLSAYFGVTPSVLLVPESAPNAFMSGTQQIILTKGLLSVLQNTDELAFVVAHELGHLKLGHVSSGDRTRSALVGHLVDHKQLVDRELQADRFALQLLTDAGFDPRAGLGLLSKLSELGSTGSGANRAYPSLQSRIEALQTALMAPRCENIEPGNTSFLTTAFP